MIRANAHAQQRLSVQTKGGEAIANVLISFRSRGMDDLADVLQCRPFIRIDQGEIFVDRFGFCGQFINSQE